MAQTLQLRIMQILDKGDEGDLPSLWCDRFITLLVLTNVCAVVLESVPSIFFEFEAELALFESVSVALFTFEYLLRVWSDGARYGPEQGGAARGRKEYALGFFGLVDLFAILPFYLQILMPGADLRVLRVLRLLRILKLSHYSSALEDLAAAVRSEARSFWAALYLLLIVTLLTSSLMYFAENASQPEKFSSIPDALYWSLITLTTVGYGDVTPVTAIGKVLSVLTAFMGVCTVAMLTGIVSSAFANQMARRKAIYESELREALSDGEISDEEARRLEAIRLEFNLPEEQIRAIAERVRKP
ncbi:MAG: potassium channel family protein [Burkholderiaceae bacterium]